VVVRNFSDTPVDRGGKGGKREKGEEGCGWIDFVGNCMARGEGEKGGRLRAEATVVIAYSICAVERSYREERGKKKDGVSQMGPPIALQRGEGGERAAKYSICNFYLRTNSKQRGEGKAAPECRSLERRKGKEKNGNSEARREVSGRLLLSLDCLERKEGKGKRDAATHIAVSSDVPVGGKRDERPRVLPLYLRP